MVDMNHHDGTHSWKEWGCIRRRRWNFELGNHVFVLSLIICCLNRQPKFLNEGHFGFPKNNLGWPRMRSLWFAQTNFRTFQISLIHPDETHESVIISPENQENNNLWMAVRIIAILLSPPYIKYRVYMYIYIYYMGGCWFLSSALIITSIPKEPAL